MDHLSYLIIFHCWRWQEDLDKMQRKITQGGNKGDKDRTRIASMDEGDLIDLHFSLGAYVRNEFGLWFGNKQLLEDCRRVSMDHYLHPDQASSIIIKELWKRLRKTHQLRVVK